MTFTKNSILVKTWVSLVVSGVFTFDQVRFLSSAVQKPSFTGLF